MPLTGHHPFLDGPALAAGPGEATVTILAGERLATVAILARRVRDTAPLDD